LYSFFLPSIIIMTPLQDFMAAAGFSVKQHDGGDSQTGQVSIVSDNAKGLKVRTSSSVTPSTPAQNVWLVSTSTKKSSSSSSRVCTACWQPSESSFASDMTEPAEWGSSSEFYEQESGSPRSPTGTIMVPVTADHRLLRPQEEPDQEEQNDKISSVVVVVEEQENNAGHDQEGEHTPRPLVKKLIQGLTYPVTSSVLKGHPRGRLSPTNAPAAA
jgi:hypothetical protein